ncbi:MAG: hypothetical protein IPP86_02550 [Bacteroidetes bacterium]|nr:hypothetical protein [Bacteroidota bacterium]
MKTSLCFKVIFLFALFCFSNKIISAQSNQYPVLAMSVQVTAISSDTSLGGLPALTDTTVFSANMSIDLLIPQESIRLKLNSVQLWVAVTIYPKLPIRCSRIIWRWNILF